MTDRWEPVSEILRGAGIDPAFCLPAFQKHLDLLTFHNQRYNLTALRTPEEMIRGHFADSLELLRFGDPLPQDLLADVGPGAGFPGFPIAVATGRALAVIESREKAAGFLESLSREPGLPACEITRERAEKAGRGEHRDRYGMVFSRALAQPPVALELCLPLVRPGGSLILWAGDSADRGSLSRIAPMLGGELEAAHEYTLMGEPPVRRLLRFRKLHPTPAEYPRKVGIPAKRPLG